MGECLFAIDSLPAYTPQLIAFLIALLEFIIVISAYIAREIQRKKTFYGREDFEDIPEEEKMEHEGAIMGKNDEELRIVQSTDRTAEAEPGIAATPTAGGVKVMVRRRKARSGISDRTETPKPKTPVDAMSIRFTLDVDRTTRGFEFISLIEKSLEEVEEFRNIRCKLSEDAEERLCDFLVHKTRTILEESTQCKYVVHAVMQNKIWKISGQDNLLEPGGDIRTQQMFRVTAQGPMSPIIILAYMIEVDVRPEGQMKPHTAPQSPVPRTIMTSKRSKLPAESVTQSISRTGKTPAMVPKIALSPAKPVTSADTTTNYLTTLRTMSTMQSEKLPTIRETTAPRSKKKDTAAYSPASIKAGQGVARNKARSAMSRIIKSRRRTTSASSKRGGKRGSSWPTVKSSGTNRRTDTTPANTPSRRMPSVLDATDKLASDQTQTGGQ